MKGLMKCFNLRALRMCNNKFSGKLPLGIVNLSQLMILDLSDNGIEGELPTMPKQLSKVHLQNNKLTRDIPISFFQLINVADVNLSNNYLSGAVSDDVVNLTRLRILRLDGNRHSLADRNVITDCITAYLPALVRSQGFKI
jgi:Leucine-rich repeat (LRR) protein